jgi:recombination protein RecA
LVPKAEIEGEMSEEKIGIQARLMSRALRKLTPSVSKTNTILIFINQIRHKVAVMFGSPETTSGGQALKFYCSVRLDVRKSDTIKGSSGEAIGTVHKVKVVKNKVGPPFRVAEFSMKFGEGINRANEVINSGINHGIVETKGAFYYAVLPGNKDKQLLGQGRDKTMDALNKDPVLMKRITDAIMEQRLRAHAAAAKASKSTIEGSKESTGVNAAEFIPDDEDSEIEPPEEEVETAPAKAKANGDVVRV